jgi:hypothetical protein
MSLSLLSRLIAAALLSFPLAWLMGVSDRASTVRMQRSLDAYVSHMLALYAHGFLYHLCTVLVLVLTFVLCVEGLASLCRRMLRWREPRP